MGEAFFIGRTKELQKLENFTLRVGTTTHRPKIAHIWAPDGFGKSAFVSRFVTVLSEETNPVISFFPDLSEGSSMDEVAFYRELFFSGDSNMGDIQPWIEQLKNSRYDSQLGSVDEYWAQNVSQMIETMTQESVIEFKGLSLLFVVDDIALLAYNLRTSFLRFLVKLTERLSQSINLVLVSTGTTDLNQVPDISNFLQSSIYEAEHIRLENLTRDETYRLLESHDLDSNLIARIFNQTQGNPKKIMDALEDQDLKSINLEESYNRGKNLMYQFNILQKRWIEWAAIVRFCNEEIISMITEGRDVIECMNWIRNNYPSYFDREGNDYVLKPDFRRAILAVVQRDEPKLYEQINEIVQKLSTVKHSIPNGSHRLLLSKLADFNYFDLPLLKKVFDEETHKYLIELIESKPVFFRQELDSYRLASNIRASISVYNSLRKSQDRQRFLQRIQGLWIEKSKAINEAMIHTEKELHLSEEKNRSLTQSLDRVETELKKIKKDKQLSLQAPPPRKIVRPKRLHVLGAVILQAIGITILYINTLVMRDMTVSQLMMAAICIIVGIIMGVSSPRQPAMVNGSVQPNQQAKEHYNNLIRNLEIDLMNLQNQKQQIQKKIESDKLTIINLQTSLNHSYLQESEPI